MTEVEAEAYAERLFAASVSTYETLASTSV
jgi:hypothetical protein